MRDRSDRYRIQTVPMMAKPKRIGAYLMDAGLLTADQVNVALNDQQSTGMRFGEVLAARGWVKEQTIEWIMEKVIVPERQSVQTQPQGAPPRSNGSSLKPYSTYPPTNGNDAHKENGVQKGRDLTPSDANAHSKQNAAFFRRQPPIAKPLPPVNSSDNDVNWVG